MEPNTLKGTGEKIAGHLARPCFDSLRRAARNSLRSNSRAASSASVHLRIPLRGRGLGMAGELYRVVKLVRRRAGAGAWGCFICRNAVPGAFSSQCGSSGPARLRMGGEAVPCSDVCMQARGVGCVGFLYLQTRSPRCVGLLYLQVRGLGVSAGEQGQRYFSKWASFRPGVYGIEGAAGIWGLCCNEWRNLTYAAVNDAFIRHRGSDSFVPKIHSKGGRRALVLFMFHVMV